ncbi:MAG: YkvA family protein [Candidatus Eisenbacteria bacterium]
MRDLRKELHALYLAAKDPRVPWYAKALAAFVVAYALSPIDLIPDFIPVIGLLDDLVVVPLGIVAARRMIPAPILTELRARADERQLARPQRKLWTIVAIVALTWVVIVVGFIWMLAHVLDSMRPWAPPGP